MANGIILALQGLLAVFIGVGGIIKIIRLNFQVEHWRDYHYPMWLLTAVGSIELIAALGLISGYYNSQLAIASAACIIILMFGAIHTHLFRAHHPVSMTIPALLCLLISATLIVYYSIR